MTAQVPHDIRLWTHNIRAGLGTDWRRRPERVIRTLQDAKPHIAVLQEADFRLGDRPTALPAETLVALTGLEPVALGQGPRSLGWHGNAVLLPPDWQWAVRARLNLPGLEPRGAVVIDVEHPWTLRIVGVHLGLIRQHRKQQIQHILQCLQELDPKPTLLAGDFNEPSRHKGLGRLAKRFHLLDVPNTFPASTPFLPLDRIAHSPDIDAHLLTPPASAWPHPSDHRPLLAGVRLNPKHR